MEKENYIYQVTEDLENRGFAVNIREVPKINGTKLGLSLEAQEGTPVATFYEEIFQHMSMEGFTVTDMGNYVIEQSTQIPDLGEIGRLVDRDFVLSRAQLCVANAEWSKDLLSVTPSKPVEGTDLSAYARISLGDGANVVPRAEQLKAAGIGGEELLQAASENSRPTYKIENLDDLISRMMGMEPPEHKSGTFVISNESAINGAAVITDPETLAAARDLVGTNEVYIIPSSIHECLAMPAGQMRPEEINAMIQEINQTEVKPEERLSDHAYVFDGTSLKEVRTAERELVAGRSR